MAPPAVEYKVHVGNLPFNTTVESLKKEFSVFGKVYDAEVVIDPETGNSRGFGFVTFANEKDMKDAMDAMDGGARPRRLELKAGYECEVGNLQPSTNERSLLVAFSKFGKVLKIDIKYNVETGESLKFAFVTFFTEKAMQYAIAEMDGEMIDRRCIVVNQKGKNNDAHPVEVGYECKVGNLSKKTSERSLKNAFKPFGKVLRTVIVEEFNEVKNEYISKGFGFVTFSSEKEMNAAIQEMNRKRLPILYHRSITVSQSERNSSCGRE